MRVFAMRSLKILAVAGSTLALFGCVMPVAERVAVAPKVSTPTKISAVGYGSIGSYGQFSSGQQRLMAARAAQIDAYRNLAERVSGFQISGATTVSAFATQNDTVRAFVDASIRGARMVGVTATPDGTYEATVEMELTPQFSNCVLGFLNCGTPMSANAYGQYAAAPDFTRYGAAAGDGAGVGAGIGAGAGAGTGVGAGDGGAAAGVGTGE